MPAVNEVVTDKGVIEYLDLGEGEPVVMLRGLGRTIRHWAGFEKQMAKHFRVICLDLRGIGTNHIPMKPTMSLFDLADDVIAVLDHLKIERATILGVSLGGMVTMATGIKYPERCHSLVIVNSSIAGQKTLRLSARALMTITRAAWDRPNLQARLVDVLTGPQLSQERKQDIIRTYNQIEREEGLSPQTVGAQLAAAARFYVAGRLKKLDVPTLVLYGSHDHFVPNKQSKKIATLIPGAKLQELAYAGHEAHLDKPDEFIAVVRTWLDDVHHAQAISTRTRK